MEDHDLTLRLGVERGFIAIEAPVTLGWRRHNGSVTMDIQDKFRSTKSDTIRKINAYPGGALRAIARRQSLLPTSDPLHSNY